MSQIQTVDRNVHPPYSLHRHALRQVPRLVDLATAMFRDEVGEQLQSHHRRDGCDERMGPWNGDEVIHVFRGLVIPFADDAENLRTTGAAFLDIAEGLVLAGDVHRQRDDWSAL